MRFVVYLFSKDAPPRLRAGQEIVFLKKLDFGFLSASVGMGVSQQKTKSPNAHQKRRLARQVMAVSSFVP